MEFQRLTERDVPEAYHLSTHVGWNQTEADWLRLLAVNPGRSLGARVAGELVATTTLASYGDSLHWVGMVIVHERHRSRGLGREVLQRGLEMAADHGSGVVGLDATELGQGLYRKSGFEEICRIDRWSGILCRDGDGWRTPVDAAAAEAVGKGDLASISTFDLEASGVDRQPLLTRMLAEDGVAAWLTADDSRLTGYAILRPGRERWQLGPLVAATGASASSLLAAAAEHLDGQEVLVDAPAPGGAGELLQVSGLTVQRRLLRMTLAGRRPALDGPWLRLASGLEWG